MADVLDLELRGEEAMAIDLETEQEEPEDVGIQKLIERARKKKGRGITGLHPNPNGDLRDRLNSDFEGITATDKEPSPADVKAQRSVEGWILIVTGINEEAHEEDVQGRFSDYGDVKNIHLNLDRRTGFLKGYALIEFENFKDAVSAKNAMDGSDLLGNKISVDWAFMKKPLPKTESSHSHSHSRRSSHHRH